MECYLDIETTGLSPSDGDLTVIGLCLDAGPRMQVIQLVENDISSANLLQAVSNVEVLYTYNGERFDLPFIRAKLGVDLGHCFRHRDLMFECWRRNLYGGLKEVERKLGICRASVGIDGRVAVELWFRYKYFGDRESLTTLLDYNKEDVCNLKLLRQKLRL
ncbi:MAG: ribonuclease H-like domain-containing protein [Deltaproteobacteria bacterium]|nr:ribonuclease H-like domain-containing protein [Deltaproteobacteria bacterium]